VIAVASPHPRGKAQPRLVPGFATGAGSFERSSCLPDVADSSSTGGPGGVDDVSWTKNVYDAAGRQTATITNWDRSGAAQLQLTSFETGTAEGVNPASNWAVAAGSSVSGILGDSATGTANSGFGSLSVTPTASSGSGVSLGLSGTFKAGHTYQATVYARATTADQDWRLTLGASGDSTTAPSGTSLSTGAFTPLTVSWQAGSDHSSGVLIAVTDTSDSSNAAVLLDDVIVWDTGSPDRNVYSLSVFDADGHPVASILPGASAGDAPMVTRTSYDQLGRATDVTVAAVAGAGEGDPAHPDVNAAVNLRTHTDFDNLGRTTATTNPAGVATTYVYDRLGRLLSATVDPGSSPHLAITALAAYDAAGDLLATCSPNAVAAGCSSANITTNGRAWRYTYDLAGHQTLATPPDNAVATDLAATTSSYELGGAGRLHQTSSGPRTTTYAYDALGRQNYVSVTTTGVGTLTTTSTLDGAGRTLSVATTGTSTDTLSESYDPLDRLLSISRSGTNITAFTYNPDGSAATRTDTDPSGASHAYSFSYTATGQLASASLPGSAGSALYTWRLDGLMATRTWGSSISGTYAYDAAKRPTNLAIEFGSTNSGTIARTEPPWVPWRLAELESGG
jgi:YD repeat-containing protein